MFYCDDQELQAKGFNVPDFPAEPQTEQAAVVRQEEDQFWVTHFFPTIQLMAEILHQLIVYPCLSHLQGFYTIWVQDFFHQQYHT